MALEKLSLEKSAQKLRLSLQKAGIISPPQVDLAFDLDVSGSFDDEHKDGTTNDLLTRFVPWGMAFDPDQKLDVFTFSDGSEHAHYVGDVTPNTYEDYVRRNIINKVPGYNSGTDYSYVIEKNLEHFGWKPTSGIAQEKKGFFGRILGGSNPAPASMPVEKKRSIVIFVTDGDNSDKQRTEQVLAESEAREDGVYFLFLGVSNNNKKFPFIEHLGERFGNVGFVAINDVAKFVQQSDDDLNRVLLGDELLEWLKK